MPHLDALVILDVAGKSGAALAFAFERAQLKAYATREPDDAFSMARTRVPQLVVVTVDAGAEQSNGSDSLALVGRLREEAETRELPIVAVGELARREEALRAGADEYVTRPAFIRDVLTLAKLAVAVRQDGDEAGVVGMLEDYGLYFLVRALAVAGRSCVLELERGQRHGEVHFAKGSVVAARVGGMSGIAALQHLMLWGEAGMAVRFESPAGERRIAANVDELLEQGAVFAHEFERLAARVGGAQAVYAQEPRRAAELHGQIPPEVLALVKQYDGHTPLIDVVEDSPFKPFDTIKITHRLRELGAIVQRPEPRDIKPLSAQLAVREWLLGADAREEPAPRGEARGVTEAGRRAAEAYARAAADQAARDAEQSPGADLFDDALPMATREPEVLPAKAEPTPAPARPQPAAAKAEPKAESSRKKRKAKQKIEAQKIEKPAITSPTPSEATKPGNGTPEPERVSPGAAAAAPSKPSHSPPRAMPAPTLPAPPATAGKVSPQAVAKAHTKEPVFDDLEEDFFAREAELARPSTVDNFDDLDHPRPKRPTKRDWFGFRKK